MSKQNKQSIQEKLQQRAPVSMRQVIKPVDMLETEQEQNNERPNEVPSERSNERSSVRMTDQTNEQMNVRSFERKNERKRVRHSFDIYQDQLLSLKEIAINREQTLEKRILLGDLVQEALDQFITNVRTNERKNE